MLEEENEEALQALVRSVNDIERGVGQYQPPSLENVSMHDYASASVDQKDSVKKRAWLRPFVATVGVLLLLGVIALVGATLWTPVQQNKGTITTTTTIDIEVWEGDFDDPSQPQTPMEQFRDHFGDPFEPPK